MIKIFVCPALVFLADLFLQGIFYPAFYQPLVVGLIFAILAHIREVAFLRRGTFWICNLLDFVSATFVVYFTQLLLTGSKVAWSAAIITAFLLTVSESVQHLILIQGDQVRKE